MELEAKLPNQKELVVKEVKHNAIKAQSLDKQMLRQLKLLYFQQKPQK